MSSVRESITELRALAEIKTPKTVEDWESVDLTKKVAQLRINELSSSGRGVVLGMWGVIPGRETYANDEKVPVAEQDGEMFFGYLKGDVVKALVTLATRVGKAG